MAFAEPIVTQLTIDGSGAERGTEQYVRAMAKAQAQMERTLAVNTRLAESYSQQSRVTQEFAAANDNAKSSIAKTAGEVLELGSKLKTLATVAYLTWPAFRNGVNLQALPALKLLHVGLSEVAPVATAAGTLMIKSFAPVFALLSKIALPILVIVAAWKALNALIDKGADLLEKYGNAGRNFDSATVVENLKKLTAFQDNDQVSLSQRQYAAELSSRLEQAKFRLKEFIKVQFDLNDAALFLQKIWVNVVETIAKAADGVTKMIGLIGQAWDKLTGLGTEIGRKIGEAIRAYVPENILRLLGAPAASNAVSGADDPTIGARSHQMRAEAAIREREALRQAGLGRLSAAMGVAAAGADPDANIGSTFAARFSASVDAIAGKTPKAKDEVAKLASEFDRLEKSMQRTAAVQEAEAKAVDASVGEHARLRAEMRLQEVAQQEIARTGKGSMEDYAERIKTLADRFAKAAQEAAELKLKSDIKFSGDTMFLSDVDKQIASIMRRIHGKDWKDFMDGPEASAIRFQKTMSDAFDFTKSAAQDFTQTLAKGLMDGASGADTMISALDALKSALLNSGIKDLFSGDPLTTAIGAVKIGASFVVDMFSDDMKAAKELQKAKDAFAAMSGEVRAFNNAADGFELSQFVSAMQQITKTGIELVKAAMLAGDTAAAIQLIVSGVKQINNTVDQFIKPKGNSVGEQIANVNNEAQQIIGELNDLNAKYGLGLNRTTEILGAAAAQIAEIQRKAQEEIDKRRLSFQDRLFAATSDNNSLAGQLAALDRAAQREIIAERDAGGQAMADLERTQIAERFNLIRDYNDKILDETKRAEEARLTALNGAAKSVVDYLAGLQSGPNATVSPLANLTNSQSLYNANLALAQGGNLDAQNKFSSLADNLEKAARAVYASSQGYQDIRNQIINQGLALPAVQQTTDPVVQAIRDSIIAIQATTGAVDVMRLALSTAITTANPANIASALSTYFNAIDTNTDNLLDFNEMVSALTPVVQNTDGSVNQAATTAALASMASNSALRDMFTRLDLDNSGNLDKAELIRQATAAAATNTGGISQVIANTAGISTVATNTGSISSVATNTSNTAANTHTANDAMEGWFPYLAGISTVATNTGSISTVANNTGDIASVATNTANLEQIATSVGGTGVIATRLSDGSTLITNTGNAAARIGASDNEGVRGLLKLLSDHLAVAGAGVSTTQASGFVNFGAGDLFTSTGIAAVQVSANSNMLTALNKIVLNTWAISQNTFGIAGKDQIPGYVGTRAMGGWINGPGGPRDDLAGLYALSNREYVVNADASRALTTQFGAGIMDTINTGRLPSNVIPFPSPVSFAGGGGHDNSALIAEIRELRREVTRLQTIVSGSGARVAQAVVETGDKQVDATNRQTRELASEERQKHRANG